MKATKGDKGDNGDEGDERNEGDAAQKILQIYAQMFAHIFVEKYSVQKYLRDLKLSLYMECSSKFLFKEGGKVVNLDFIIQLWKSEHCGDL